MVEIIKDAYRDKETLIRKLLLLCREDNLQATILITPDSFEVSHIVDKNL